MTLFDLENEGYEAWNDFVLNNTGGTFFHCAEWRDIINGVFGCKTFYLYKKKGTEISGILPLALVKKPIFGAALISAPLGVYGGGLGDYEELEIAARKKANDLGVQFLELRANREGDWQSSDQFYTFHRELSNDHDENLKSIPRKQRAEVRKGIKHNLKTIHDQNIDLFYKIYARSVRDLGTPVFPTSYLKALIETFTDKCVVTSVFYKDEPLTSVLSFIHQDQILPYYGGGLPAARNYSAYPFMYWKVMEYATDHGLKVFDFGRSMKDSGAYHFKKNFGFEPEQLPYSYHLVKAARLPDMDADSPRNKLLTGAWKKLPLPVANTLGPFLYKIIM